MKFNFSVLAALTIFVLLPLTEQANADDRPTIAIMIGEAEYETTETLPAFADNHLKDDYRVVTILEDPEHENHFPGVEQLDEADVLLLSVRRKTLPPQQLAHVRKFEQDGKPILGIRTANHAFSLRNKPAPEGTADWPAIDAEVFGGNYTNHFPKGTTSTITIVKANQSHPIVAGLSKSSFEQAGTLYKTSPLAEGAEVLLMGQLTGDPNAVEPVAWTFTRANGGKSFYTSLGHSTDFEIGVLNQILKNAIDWASR